MLDLARSIRQTLRSTFYRRQFDSKLAVYENTFPGRVVVSENVDGSISGKKALEEIARLSPTTNLLPLSLRSDALTYSAADYWKKYRNDYSHVGNGREKALEHALALDLFDFTQVKRYCDVATARSPFANALKTEYPEVEHWKQDLLLTTDLPNKTIGGFAQDMKEIESGFFDALTLHCAFEHFEQDSDSRFVHECDRILSDRGACLIVPLYLNTEAKIYFDPTVSSMERVKQYDPEATLAATRNYRQEHGRFYSPASLYERVLKNVPPTLRATLISFEDQAAVDSSIYLRFGLVFHRKNSIFRQKNNT